MTASLMISYTRLRFLNGYTFLSIKKFTVVSARKAKRKMDNPTPKIKNAAISSNKVKG